MGIKPRELLRTSESIYRELELAKHDLSDNEIISLMVKHPDLIQRPIVERGDRAVLGRPTENVRPFLRLTCPSPSSSQTFLSSDSAFPSAPKKYARKHLNRR